MALRSVLLVLACIVCGDVGLCATIRSTVVVEATLRRVQWDASNPDFAATVRRCVLRLPALTLLPDH